MIEIDFRAALAVSNGWIPGSATEDWHNATANTNAASLLSGQMGVYAQHDVHIFKCPADVVSSDNGSRLRSYSMNGQMGASVSIPNYNAGWRQYAKGADLTCPTPANAFIFADEHPGSINDGYLQGSLNTAAFSDVPASYLDGGCGFGFADGHAEIHLWQSSTLLIPVQHNISVGNIATSPTNPDWQWLKLHSACKP